MNEKAKTVLFEEHKKLGCKFFSFGGFEMPLNYEKGVIAEHRYTRQHSGLFDISHMGRFLFQGESALSFLRFVLTNDAGLLDIMKAQYTFISDENGNILDDAILYRIGTEEYMLAVNASNAEKDWLHISEENRAFGAKMTDITKKTGMLAVQGPKSIEILENLFLDQSLSTLRKNEIVSINYNGDPVLVSRTGYTGEKYGFELFIPSTALPQVWCNLLSLGANPCGLGARDTLRIEAGFPLYGQELGKDALGREIPVYANPSAFFGINFADEKREFIGKEALRIQKDSCEKSISVFELMEKGMPRSGSKVTSGGKEVGYVTSGNAVPHSPEKDDALPQTFRYIGLALIDRCFEQGEIVEIILPKGPVSAVLRKSILADNQNDVVTAL